MKKITKEEEKKIEGGANFGMVTVIISGIITFITGLLSGYSNPKKCNN